LRVGEIDKKRVIQYLAEIRESLSMLKDITSTPVDDFVKDAIKIRAMKYTLIVLVETICNLFRHILAKKWHISVEEYMEAVIKMRDMGMVSERVYDKLIPLVKLRHQLIHGYWKTDDRRLFEETRQSLWIIEELIREMKKLVNSSQR